MSSAIRQRPIWLVITAASLPMFMATLDNLVVTNALPVIARDLNANIEQLQWVINAYSLAFASLILMAVALGDRWGRVRVFLGGLGLFTVASALCASAPTIEMLIAARALQGVGAAALMPLSLAILSSNVEARLRPMAIGIWGGVAGLGVALGPLIGGAVVDGMSWHAIFWLNVPVALVSAPIIIYALRESYGKREPVDVVGVILGMFGVFALVFGIVRGNEAGWMSAQVLTGLVGGIALLAGFIAWEARSAHALLPLRLFRDRSFAAANVVGLLFGLGIFGAIFILIQFFQVVQAKSALQAGVMTMPWTMAPLVVAPLAGFIAPKVGTRALIVAGVSLQAVGLAWIALTLAPDAQYSQFVGAFILCGVGMGLVFAPSATAVLANMRQADHAKASGTNSTVREVGVALGVAILTAIFLGSGGELTPAGYTDAAIPAVYTGVVALILAAIAACFLPAGTGTPDAETTMPHESWDEPVMAARI